MNYTEAGAGNCEWCRATSGSQVIVSQCQERGCQTLPAVNNLPTDREGGEGTSQWETTGDTEKTQLLNENFSREQMCSICQTSYKSLFEETVFVCKCVCVGTNGISLCTEDEPKASARSTKKQELNTQCLVKVIFPFDLLNFQPTATNLTEFLFDCIWALNAK